ncbi:MAG TPA: hypothetical protein VK872_11345, partial [Draconibacterium sp.]|nr:hypothetical protein [Draconibacterium sp.]
MKILYLTLLSIVFLSFNAFSQNKLKIVNISENQESSGSIIVKLDTVNIKDFRFVSYYMGDEFISNIYEAPFTIQLDTRDFANGKQVLNVKAIHIDGIVAT